MLGEALGDVSLKLGVGAAQIHCHEPPKAMRLPPLSVVFAMWRVFGIRKLFSGFSSLSAEEIKYFVKTLKDQGESEKTKQVEENSWNFFYCLLF